MEFEKVTGKQDFIELLDYFEKRTEIINKNMDDDEKNTNWHYIMMEMKFSARRNKDRANKN